MVSVNKDYDYIVVGCGGIGSAAVYWLSRTAGSRVLGLEQFGLGHDRGGSQDHSRIIRMLYHNTAYTRLVADTYRAFGEVEAESGIKLVHKTGTLELAVRGTKGAKVIELYATAMDAQNIKYERLSAAQLNQRFPQFRVDSSNVILYQEDGGLVDAALSNSVHIQLAQSRGATVLDNTPVTRIDTQTDGSAVVYTPTRTYSCKKVIVTAGAWVNHVLGSVGLNIPLMITQEQVTYYATPHPKKFTKDNFPVFLYHGFSGDLDIYGLPLHGNSGTKIGIDAAGPLVTPETRNYIPDPVREQTVFKFLTKCIPEFLGPKMYTKTCLYTMPMDRDFIIDTLKYRGKPQIIVCNGAGHGFKFACLFGKILSELAVSNRTQYNIDAFTIDRPAVNDPNYGGGRDKISGTNPLYAHL